MDETIPITRSQNTVQSQLPVLSDAPQKLAFPTEVIDLPSEGHFYPSNHALSSGRLEIKYMTAREEDILTSSNLIKKGVVLDELLRALIVTPGVALEDLLLGDKNAVFIAARRLAYGDDYPVKVKCPSCGESTSIVVDLKNLHAKNLDFSQHEKGRNLFEFVLPGCKKTIKYRLLTHRDDDAIDAELKALAKLDKSAKSPEVTTRLKYMIVAVDGKDDRSYVKNFVDSLLSKDALEFRRHVREHTPDIDMSFSFTCSHCDYTERMAVPMGVDFFWPDSRV